METIVYASRAARAMEEGDLGDLLADARAHNGPDGVTGMLLYADGSFLQQLEGEEAVLEATFSRIQTDDRHTEIRVLSRRTIEERRFPEWTMGFATADATALARRLEGYRSPGAAPLVSSELIQDAEVAETVLGLYALGVGA